MADYPGPFGTVHGRIYAAVGDTVDAGRTPDRIGLNGTATFTANIERIVTTTPGSKAIDVPQKIVAQVVNGALQWLGTDDVPLIANLDAGGVSLGWQWRVDWSLTYTDPTTNAASRVTLTGWAFDVKVNPTITDITDQAPVVGPNVAVIAKGDAGPAVNFVVGTVTTTTDPAAALVTIVPTADPLVKELDFVLPVGAGGGGGSGTVTKVAGVSPDGAGNVALSPSTIGAAAAVDLQTAQATASNALTTANAAQSAANTAQTTANTAQSGLASKADSSALFGLAPLASPTFTGDPKAPTPVTTDNDTSVATTAFVRSAITTYAPTASTASPVAELVWDAPTQKWVNGAGAVVTARPTAKLVVLYGTTDANAVKPSWLAIGDVGIWHPDSAYNI